LPIILFTDGAAKGNPGPGGWGAIVVTPDRHVAELGGGSPHTTNNKMELSGAIAALQHIANQPGPVAIYTDSTYVIQGITQWVWGWRTRGWKTAQGGDVLNRDLWEQLSSLVARRSRGRELALGPRSCRDTGQQRADQFQWRSRAGIMDLYVGPFDGYAADSVADGVPSSCPGVVGETRSPHTVGVVEGVPMRHVTWAECEGRVKGSRCALSRATSAADNPRSGLGNRPSESSHRLCRLGRTRMDDVFGCVVVSPRPATRSSHASDR
jgi:ribonuclease HI